MCGRSWSKVRAAACEALGEVGRGLAEVEEQELDMPRAVGGEDDVGELGEEGLEELVAVEEVALCEDRVVVREKEIHDCVKLINVFLDLSFSAVLGLQALFA